MRPSQLTSLIFFGTVLLWVEGCSLDTRECALPKIVGIQGPFLHPRDFVEVRSLGEKVYYQGKYIGVIAEYRAYGCLFKGVMRPSTVLFSKHLAPNRDRLIKNINDIIAAVSLNESADPTGQFPGYDAINAYDRAGLSVGLIQWTAGTGDLGALLQYFSERYEIDFILAFATKGILVNEKGVIVDPSRSPIRLTDLRTEKYIACFIEAAKNKQFQKAQEEFIQIRLERALSLTKNWGVSFTLPQGQALILDMHVKGDMARPIFRRALAQFTGRNEIEQILILAAHRHRYTNRREIYFRNRRLLGYFKNKS